MSTRWRRRRAKSGQGDGDQAVDGVLAGEGAGRGEGVQAVSGQFVGGHVVADIAVPCRLGDQVVEKVVESLPGVVDVLATVQQRGEFAAVVVRRVVLDLGVRVQDGLQAYQGRVGRICRGGQLVKVGGDLTFVPGGEDRGKPRPVAADSDPAADVGHVPGSRRDVRPAGGLCGRERC